MTDETAPTTNTTTIDAPAAERVDRPARKPAVVKPKRRRGAALSDPVADMLTRLRNGVTARHETVDVPLSREKVEIARILKAEGFISGFERTEGQITLKLKYIGGKTPAVSGLRRISKPGLRVYARKTEMPRVLGGLGIVIVSTSSGVMTGREAEKRGLGGEVVAYVW